MRLILVGAATLLVGAAGWLGYVGFARSDVGGGLGLGTVALAAGTGMGVFFAPCSFPLLLTHITDRRGPKSRFEMAGTFASGAVVFFAAVAALVLAGGESLATVLAFDTVPGRVFRGFVALGLAALGLQQAGLIRFRSWLSRVSTGAGRLLHPTAEGGRWAPVGYGFAYPLVGFG